MSKIKLAWGSDYAGDIEGNGFGYSTHNENLLREVSKLVDIDNENADDIIFIASLDCYRKRFGKKREYFFSMFEGTDLPEKFQKVLNMADYLLVPSTWVKEMFSKYFNSYKIYVINHGCQLIYTYKKRKFPHKKKFRYLYVGAPNPRKGLEEIFVAWKAGEFYKNPNIELYIKTTTGIRDYKVMGNIIWDQRKLSKKELVNLYHSSHCFLIPHRGEGFGLTLMEAMATGLPCIATNYSGVTDFFDEDVGYPLQYNLKTDRINFIGEKMSDGKDIIYDTQMAHANMEELIDRMCYVYIAYNKALVKGTKASIRIKKNFTWEKSAKKLVDIIKKNGGY